MAFIQFCFFLFYRTSLVEGSFFSECFTFFKFQSIVFLNPLRITILGAQVVSAKRILCTKLLLPLEHEKNTNFMASGVKTDLPPIPPHLLAEEREQGARCSPLLSRESSGGSFGTDATITALSQGTLSERKEIEIPPQIPARSFEDSHIFQGLSHHMYSLKCLEV